MQIVTKRDFNKNVKKYLKMAEKEMIVIKPKKHSWPQWVLMSSAEHDGLLGY